MLNPVKLFEVKVNNNRIIQLENRRYIELIDCLASNDKSLRLMELAAVNEAENEYVLYIISKSVSTILETIPAVMQIDYVGDHSYTYGEIKNDLPLYYLSLKTDVLLGDYVEIKGKKYKSECNGIIYVATDKIIDFIKQIDDIIEYFEVLGKVYLL